MLHRKLPTKPCHNCRRLRLRCDRSIPTCQKCHDARRECLGYGKQFKWNEGVASRGRMVGKTFSDPPQTERSQSNVAVESPLSSDAIVSYQTQRVFPDSSASQQHDDACLQRVLVDPLLQDLHPNLREYLFHCKLAPIEEMTMFASAKSRGIFHLDSTRLCYEVVLDHLNLENPLQDILPLAAAHPLVMQIIIANSAYHLFNLYRQAYRKGQSFTQSTDLVSSNPLLRQAYKDALIAKQSALRLLNSAIGQMDDTNADIIVACVHMFINLELIDSGKYNWRVHVEGAKKLFATLGSSYIESIDSCQASNMSLGARKFFLAESFIFCIMGSTASPSLATTWPDIPQVFNSIQTYSEIYSYLFCPGELLEILLHATALCGIAHSKEFDESSHKSHFDKMKTLLLAAQSFSPREWAASKRSILPCEDLKEHVYLASAHKAAVTLYIVRNIPEEYQPVDTIFSKRTRSRHLATEILYHLCFIHPGDMLFKSTTWPTFMAGTEIVDSIERDWVVDRMNSLWDAMHLGYIRSSQEMLETIWEGRINQKEDMDITVDWTTRMSELGADLLVI